MGLLRRRTPSEREREKIEAAEFFRRMREGESDTTEEAETDPLTALRNPRVAVLDPEVREALREYELASRREERESHQPAPKPEAPVCWKHDWYPEPPFPGAPRPLASECPECKAEREAKPTGQVVYVTDGGSLTPRATVPLHYDEAYNRHLEKQDEDGGRIEAGSEEERITLDRIDALRPSRDSDYVGFPPRVYEGRFGDRRYVSPAAKRRRARSPGDRITRSSAPWLDEIHARLFALRIGV